MRIFNFVFIFVFILFAALQYNDPDPYLWIPIYLYPALLCYWAFKLKPIHIKLYWAAFAGFGSYAIYKLFDTNGIIDWIRFHEATSITSTMKAEQPWVEESREFFGLIIILVVLAINYFNTKKQAFK